MAGRWDLRTGDVSAELAKLEANSIHSVVTSPPYWGLRDYQIDGQLGLEATPGEYVERMVEVFREVRRVLRPDGTLWLNLGDSFSHGGCGGRDPERWPKQSRNDHYPAKGSKHLATHAKKRSGLKPKDLVGIPWRVALALQADGWWLRADVIWAKPNGMPEGVNDRPTRAHEYLFLMTKRARYFYDAHAIAEPLEHPDAVVPSGFGGHKGSGPTNKSTYSGNHYDASALSSRNKRDVWTVCVEPYPGPHYATMPTALAETCIRAGTSERGVCAACGEPWRKVVRRARIPRRSEVEANPRDGGIHREHGMDRTGISHHAHDNWLREHPPQVTGWSIRCDHAAGIVPATVLDPFAGAGTTLLVADRLGRASIGIELNPASVADATRRLAREVPLFAARRA